VVCAAPARLSALHIIWDRLVTRSAHLESTQRLRLQPHPLHLPSPVYSFTRPSALAPEVFHILQTVGAWPATNYYRCYRVYNLGHLTRNEIAARIAMTPAQSLRHQHHQPTLRSCSSRLLRCSPVSITPLPPLSLAVTARRRINGLPVMLYLTSPPILRPVAKFHRTSSFGVAPARRFRQASSHFRGSSSLSNNLTSDGGSAHQSPLIRFEGAHSLWHEQTSRHFRQPSTGCASNHIPAPHR
jgi:hypothetical protein